MMAAAELGSGVDVILPWINLGATGLVVVMVVLRKGLVPEWVLRDKEREITELKAEKAKLIEALDDSTQIIMNQIIPLATRMVDAETRLLKQPRWEEDRPDPPSGRQRGGGRGR